MYETEYTCINESEKSNFKKSYKLDVPFISLKMNSNRTYMKKIMQLCNQDINKCERFCACRSLHVRQFEPTALYGYRLLQFYE